MTRREFIQNIAASAAFAWAQVRVPKLEPEAELEDARRVTMNTWALGIVPTKEDLDDAIYDPWEAIKGLYRVKDSEWTEDGGIRIGVELNR